jgi:type I restriction enzyme M protein
MRVASSTPACGSGGLFVQSAKFIGAHGGRQRDIRIYGQEKNQATWRIGEDEPRYQRPLGRHPVHRGRFSPRRPVPEPACRFRPRQSPVQPKGWGADRVSKDARWKSGLPPDSNANYAWIQHFIAHLAPDGRAGFVLANGSVSDQPGGQAATREAIVRDDTVDCIVACPKQLFFTTQIPVCLWFLDRNKASSGRRDRRGETLFIDARRLGTRISRTQVELTSDDLGLIAETYHTWRDGRSDQPYSDTPRFAHAASLAEIERQGFLLSPGRYVGAEESDDLDEEPPEERLERLAALLRAQFDESARLAARVDDQLSALGYER